VNIPRQQHRPSLCESCRQEPVHHRVELPADENLGLGPATFYLGDACAAFACSLLGRTADVLGGVSAQW
jgi:hypothetical protein